METKLTFWYEISTCPECGKKLQPTNGLIVPYRYVCKECYWTNACYHKAVDDEPNLRYDRSCL